MKDDPGKQKTGRVEWAGNTYTLDMAFAGSLLIGPADDWHNLKALNA